MYSPILIIHVMTTLTEQRMSDNQIVAIYAIHVPHIHQIHVHNGCLIAQEVLRNNPHSSYYVAHL